MQHYAIIVAGGSGSRMGSQTPKQFMLLSGEPVLVYSLRAFHQQNPDTQLIVVLNESLQDEWRELTEKYSFTLSHQLVNGGETRFESVSNALIYLQTLPDFLPESSLVAVHDAARPLVSTELISRCFADAKQSGSSVATVKSSNSVRIETATGTTETVDRDKVYMVQTPQVFKAPFLLKGYEQAYEPVFTDDASVVEKAGYHLHLTAGDTRNIKITFPEDISLAESLIQSKEWLKQPL